MYTTDINFNRRPPLTGFKNYEFDIDKEFDLDKMKGKLNAGSQEDAALLRQIENYERALKGPFAEAKKLASGTLAKKNLAKVYGKT